MARAGKTKTARSLASKNAGFDFEAIGLIMLALGAFLLAVFIPQFPTGDWGEQIRRAFTDRIAWGAFALPWPLILYGSLLLIGRVPKYMLRRSSGYFVFMFGVWCIIMLAQPSLAGSWGQQLRAPLAGMAGWLSYLFAFFFMSLGIDIVMRWPLGFTTRGFTQLLVRSSRHVGRQALALRQEWKERAAFYADIALLKNALRDLDKDLKALHELYPNHQDISKWRKLLSNQQQSLKHPKPSVLRESQLQLDGWRGAVEGFTKVQAEELSRKIQAEGIADFAGRIDSLSESLNEALNYELAVAQILNDIRQSLLLEKVVVTERYHDLLLKRDHSLLEINSLSPRALVIAKKQHFKRLEAYGKIIETVKTKSDEAKLLEPWRDFCEHLERLQRAFPDAKEFNDLDQLASKELRKVGRKALLEFSSWQKTLVSAEQSIQAIQPQSIELEDSWKQSEDLDFSDDFQLLLDSPMPDIQPELLQKPLPPLKHHGLSHNEMEQLRLFPYALDKDSYSPEKTPEANSDIGGIPIQLPSFELLDDWESSQDDPNALKLEVQARVRKIDETLANFKLDGRVVASVRGPSVTRFEVEPAPGEKISRFANLSNDLALAMAVGGVRIEAPIPGKSVIGLEVPNANRDLIRFREAAASNEFRRSRARLPIILGQSIDGEMKVGDLARMPHMLIAGSTGSGKSVAVNTIIASLLYKFLPTELRFLMIDPKMVELTPFDGIPHLIQPVVTNPNDAAGVLLGAVAHMERRYKMMSKIGAKTIDQYNEKARHMDLSEMPIIIIVIDELADLMITSPKEVESSIMRLAQMARATGMHLILATQRPSVDILTSLIKVNVPARMAFAVSSGHDSRTILDTMGAERLIGSGDMLYNQPGMVKPIRLQGPFIKESELVNIANFLRRQFFDDDFAEAYGSDFEAASPDDSDATGFVDWNDDKLRVAAEIVIAEGYASVSRLQRRLQVGHARAGKLIDSLEVLNVVGPHQGSKPRDVLITYEQLPDIFRS